MQGMARRESARQHARKRAAERYGIDLTQKRERQIVGMLKSGDWLCCHRQSRYRSLYRILLGDEPVDVVYDSRLNRIVTLLAT